MTAELATTFYTIGYSQTIAQSMEQNKVDVLVLTANQYMTILQDKAKNNPHLEYSLRKILGNSVFGQYWTKTFSPNAGEVWVGPAAQSANDAVMITKTLNALGMTGITSYIKSTSAGTYIIIKGYAALRSSALQGTRYLATNPKMIEMGLGMKGLGNVAKGGFILGVVVSSGLEVADFIFNDEKTMYDLVGGIGVEAVKGGLGAMAAYAIAGVIGSATTVAIFPLIGMAVAAFLVGTYLNDLDKTHNIKQRVIDAMKAFPDQTAQGIYVINTEAESWLARVRAGVQAKQIEVHQGLMDWLCPICRRY